MDEAQAKEFGAYIRQHREAVGVSTRELAAAVGLDMAQIVRWENGRVAYPRADVLGNMANALHVPMSDLMAMACYPVAKGLPGLRPYMRAKYRDLPAGAVDEVEAFIAKLQRDHSPGGPTAGEDET